MRQRVGGHWVDGLLPPPGLLPRGRARGHARPTTGASARWSIDDLRDGALRDADRPAGWSDELRALDAISFAAWLDREGLHAPALRWYLDYCCRDDYGAGSGAGLGLGRPALFRQPARLRARPATTRRATGGRRADLAAKATPG